MIVREKTGRNRVFEQSHRRGRKISGRRLEKKVRTQVLTWFQSNVSNKSYTMEQVYEIAGISRQGHYSHQKRLVSKLAKTESLLSVVRETRLSHPRMGSRPLYKLLNVEGIGINQFEKLLAREGLGIKRKRNRHKTTDGSKYKGGLSNLLNGIEIDTINQV